METDENIATLYYKYALLDFNVILNGRHLENQQAAVS